jgi:ribonuclease E
MAGLKVTLDAAMRARDVSEPTAAQNAQAEIDLPDTLSLHREVPAPRQPADRPGQQASRPRPAPRPARQPRADRQARPDGQPSTHTQAGPDSQPRPDGQPRPDVRPPTGTQAGPGSQPRADTQSGFRPRGAVPDLPGQDLPAESVRPAPGGQPRMRRRSRLGRTADQGSGGNSAAFS